MFPTRTHWMRAGNQIEIPTALYKKLTFPYFRQFFRPNNSEGYYGSQHHEPKSPMDRAIRYAEIDVNFHRVYSVLDQLTLEERLKIAMLEANKVTGITDSVNFAKTGLEKYQLSPEGKSQILKILDEKTKGVASKSFKNNFVN